MKLRIKANSLRIRLTKTEVSTLANTGYLEDKTVFPTSTFIYAVQSVEEGKMTASFEINKITLSVPSSFIKDWPENEIVGLKGNIRVHENENLALLIEKDFVCLDDTTEDQSDNYMNPNSIC